MTSSLLMTSTFKKCCYIHTKLNYVLTPVLHFKFQDDIKFVIACQSLVNKIQAVAWHSQKRRFLAR